MAGFQLTLHGRIWVTPEGMCVSMVSKVQEEHEQKIASNLLTSKFDSISSAKECYAIRTKVR
jgi:hypothetical protein